MADVPVLHIPTSAAQPDNDQWQFRFEIRSQSSNRVYVVAQHKKGKYWGCSCPGWKAYKKCKHLQALGIPGYQTPYEPKIVQR